MNITHFDVNQLPFLVRLFYMYMYTTTFIFQVLSLFDLTKCIYCLSSLLPYITLLSILAEFCPQLKILLLAKLCYTDNACISRACCHVDAIVIQLELNAMGAILNRKYDLQIKHSEDIT